MCRIAAIKSAFYKSDFLPWIYAYIKIVDIVCAFTDIYCSHIKIPNTYHQSFLNLNLIMETEATFAIAFIQEQVELFSGFRVGYKLYFS